MTVLAHESDEELPAWSLPASAEEALRVHSPWPPEVSREWAWGGATGAGVRDRCHVAILRSSLRSVAGVVTDAELVSRCRAGEQAAWNELVERFSRYVYAICHQAFRLSDADAEDVFQEVFARVYENLGRLRSDDAVRPWIAQLTRRLCIDRFRSGGREGPADSEELDSPVIDETLAGLDEALTVRACLDAVGDPCRDILDRFFCRDESYKAIGDALDLPAGTIASRISRCLGKVKAELEGRS